MQRFSTGIYCERITTTGLATLRQLTWAPLFCGENTENLFEQFANIQHSVVHRLRSPCWASAPRTQHLLAARLYPSHVCPRPHAIPRSRHSTPRLSLVFLDAACDTSPTGPASDLPRDSPRSPPAGNSGPLPRGAPPAGAFSWAALRDPSIHGAKGRGGRGMSL